MNNDTKWTAKQMMNNEIDHHTYNMQFVTPSIIAYVNYIFGEDRIKASKDPYHNDIPLRKWDRMDVRPMIDSALWKELHNTTYPEKNKNDFLWSPSCNVTILKTAACHIRGW